MVEGWDSGRVGAASVAAGFATAAPKPVSPLAADKALLLLPACRVEAAVADCGCDPKENPGVEDVKGSFSRKLSRPLGWAAAASVCLLGPWSALGT